MWPLYVQILLFLLSFVPLYFARRYVQEMEEIVEEYDEALDQFQEIEERLEAYQADIYDQVLPALKRFNSRNSVREARTEKDIKPEGKGGIIRNGAFK